LININLTPVEELEDKNWWLPDLVLFAIFTLAFLGGVDFYLNQTRIEIEAKESNISAMETEIVNLKPQSDKFTDYKDKVQALGSKKDALIAITKSKILRYLPIILLESLQTLRPEGLWFEGLEFVQDEAKDNSEQAMEGMNDLESENGAEDTIADRDGKTEQAPEALGISRRPIRVKILGKAVNNVIVAEFMSALNATQHNAFEKSDLRTQAFFSDVKLSFSEVEADQKPDSLNILNFDLLLTFEEKDEQLNDTNLKVSHFIESFRKNGKAKMR
jgi:hypothetical protein